MPEETSKDFDLQKEVDRLLLAYYTPASVVVDANMEILHVRGHTSPYLELAPGKASFNLLKMARTDLLPSLRIALHASQKENCTVTKERLQISDSDTTREVRLSVMPLKGSADEPYFLVLFEEMPWLPIRSPASPSFEETNGSHERGSAARRLAALEQELAATRVQMQDMIKERDAAYEELQTANEEILTSNEKLQSLDEEMEASKERQQAINDELTSINQELEMRNEQLKEAQDYAEAIVETVRQPLVVLDADLRVQRANSAFYLFFVVVPAQTEGHSFFELGDGQWDLPCLRTLLEEVLTTNQSFKDFEVEQGFPIIGHKIMSLNARRFLYEPEGVGDHLVLLTMEDVTERKEQERQKDTFLDIVSHELRSPVSIVKLRTHLLQKRLVEAGDEQSAADLARIDTHLNDLSRLINDLYQATALGRGILPMNQEPFVVDELVRSVVDELGSLYPASHLLIEGEAPTEVYADRERIGQVLINLLSNAINYSPPTESVLVRVSVEPEEVTVSVQDRGVGIPQDQQARIFDRFSRSGESKQAQMPGLGLGLYIAAQIVKQQGGRIWVKSKPGKGSTFAFTIPRRTFSAVK